MDQEWAIGQLETFVQSSAILGDFGSGKRPTYVGDMRHPKDGVGSFMELVVIVEKILDKVTPRWRPSVVSTTPDYLRFHREAAHRAVVELRHGTELQQRLGASQGPPMALDRLHPWVRDAAHSLWESHHFSDAVRAAARRVNSEAQRKVDRRDVSETELFRQAFSSDPPRPGSSRLRPAGDDGGKTSLSRRRGIMAFAEGCYGAIRNPASHDEVDLDEQTALEQLATFSVLARWIDDAEVVSDPADRE